MCTMLNKHQLDTSHTKNHPNTNRVQTRHRRSRRAPYKHHTCSDTTHTHQISTIHKEPYKHHTCSDTIQTHQISTIHKEPSKHHPGAPYVHHTDTIQTPYIHHTCSDTRWRTIREPYRHHTDTMRMTCVRHSDITRKK